MTTQSEWVCCCGKELDGSHDHNSCGPPEPRSGGEVIARPVADRLSAALELLLLRYEQCVADNGELWEHQCETAAKDALADYRKAVSP